ncbi:Amino acid transporter avt6a [Ranunculus cassubicifolius]
MLSLTYAGILDPYGGRSVLFECTIRDVLSGTSASGDHHAGILEGWFGVQWWNGRFFVLLVTTLAIFSPLACIKRVDSLRYTSALSVALAVVFVVITAGITIVKIINGSVAMPRWFPVVTDMTSVFKLFTVVPVLVTAYICHYNVHTIHNELEDSSKMQSIVQTSLGLCSTVYITTSFFGFLLFGDSTLDDVLANFDTNLGILYSSLLNDVVRVSYAVHLMLVFPIIFFALRINLDGLLFPTSGPMVSEFRQQEVFIDQHIPHFDHLLRCQFHSQYLGCFPVHWSYCCCMCWIHLSRCHCSQVSSSLHKHIILQKIGFFLVLCFHFF